MKSRVWLYWLISLMTLQVSASDLMTTGDLEQYRALAADKKAYRVGDTLTILIVERSQAKASADTGTNKGRNFSVGVSGKLGNRAAGLEMGSERTGDASTGRNGFINAQITATVIGKNAMGHLVIRGEQIIAINGEEQSISVEGTVRATDINTDNTVLSNRLTNARLAFVGKGDVSQANEEGIFSKLLSWLGL